MPAVDRVKRRDKEGASAEKWKINRFANVMRCLKYRKKKRIELPRQYLWWTKREQLMVSLLIIGEGQGVAVMKCFFFIILALTTFSSSIM